MWLVQPSLDEYLEAYDPSNRPVIARYAAVPQETQSIPDFSKGNGLLPAIAQDAESGEVLMLAYMNPESFAETIRSRRAVYYSRSRGGLWRKGDESGHVQEVRQVLVDCDGDTILLKVDQRGAACHKGYRSCFFREVTPQGVVTVATPVFDPQAVYGGQPTDPAV